MPLGNSLQDGFGNNSPDCHRVIGGNGGAGLSGGRNQTRLVEIWMMFKLICCQGNVRQFDGGL
jgi:hypothetical protein